MQLRAFSRPDVKCTRWNGASVKSAFALLQIVVLGIGLSACQRPSTLMPHPPTGEGSSAPHLEKTTTGEVVLSYLEPVDESMELRYAVLEEGGWSVPKTVARGVDWFVSWADIPSVVPLTESLWASHWRVTSSAGALSYNTAMSMSVDGGRSWQPATWLNTDSTPTEHGFVSVYQMEEAVGAIWLDGRAYAEGRPGQLAGAQLRAVTLSSKNVRKGEVVIDDLVCDCCQTDAAISKGGPIIVYRNRSENEIRDIYFARHFNGKWNEGHTIASDGWKINGCPINGPVIDAAGERVAIAWYTAAPKPKVQVLFSNDNGETFTNPVKLSADDPLGRVDVVLLPDGSAAVSWLEQGEGQLMIQRVAPDGLPISLTEVAKIETGRNAGFPQMIYSDGRLIFAWTDVSTQLSRVRTAWLKL